MVVKDCLQDSFWLMPATPEFIQEGIPYITSKNIKGQEIRFDDVKYISREDYENVSKNRPIQEDDILISMIGTIGEAGIVTGKCGEFYGQNVYLLRMNRDKVRNRFLLYFMRCNTVKRLLDGKKNTSTQAYLKADHIESLILPDYEVSKQDEIIDRLDKLSLIIDKRKQELEQLDLLIKARFVEMFGDPISNSKDLDTTELINIVKFQRGFDLPVQDRVQAGTVPVFGANGVLDYHDEAKVLGGGVITGRSGSIGKVYYTEKDYWPLNTSLFSVNLHGNNIIYLSYLLDLFDLSRFADGTGVPTLNRNNIHNKKIIFVSKEQQDEFALFVTQVDKSKFAII